MKRILKNYWLRLTSVHRDDEGFVLMTTLIVFFLLYIFCSAIYAVGDTINSRIKIQNACDAAAYSAAVVQADGLSRMAIVNKAMSWTYVQMTNRQMDYVTYRWMKLTLKRYNEDYSGAERYRAQLIACIDREIGWWAIIEAVVSMIIDALLPVDCNTGKHRYENGQRAFWCSSIQGTKNRVSFNTHTLSLPTDIVDKTVLKIFGVIFDSEDSPSGWASRLGWLIDNDKKNINNLNVVLDLINQQMTQSMRATAESVLKSSLSESKGGSETSNKNFLKDYYISIKIPKASNPYNVKNGEENTSFFSALHNTEPDERIFLQMQTTDNANMNLAAHFPVLLGGHTNQACGIDQWFIRGKGVYEGVDSSDDEDANDKYCLEKPAKTTFSGGKSGQLDDGGRLAGTVRDEGTLGIQRVYKDTNLNETKAGALQQVNRGNHVLMLTDILKGGFDTAMGFFQNQKTGQDSFASDEAGSVEEAQQKLQEQASNLNGQKEKLEDELKNMPADDPGRAQKEAELANINSRIGETQGGLLELQGVGSSITPGGGGLAGGGLAGGGAGGGGGGSDNNPMDFITGIFSDVLNNRLGSLLDVHPSCENEGPSSNFWPPMCTEANDTTALVAEYRWASCKWFCCTKFATWALSLIFEYPHIWCDMNKHTFKKILGIKIKGKGYGHWGFPKWFCGAEPHALLSGWSGGLLDRFLQFFPPLDPEPIKGFNHGYMDGPMGNYDFEGFIKPLLELFTKMDISRDEYCSCAMFMDYAPIPVVGSACPAGLVRGHARIYGDDKEIFDNRYVGARCKPWVLNERFFSGDGTIVVGAAMKMYNPFVQVFNSMGGDGVKKISPVSVLSAFDVPENAHMWTMSAARAGVRHHRRNAKYDQDRMYQVVFDSTSDPENLAYQKNSARMLKKDADKFDTGDSWQSARNGESETDNHGMSRGQDGESVWDGCVCSGNNARQFINIWNLCEPDWDATLLPVRYAMQGATLQSSADGDDSFTEKDYNGRRQMINKLDNDKLSDGQYWRWGTTSYESAAKTVDGTAWVSASGDYFTEIEKILNINLGDGPNLNNKFPLENRNNYFRKHLFMLNKIL